MTSPTLTDDLVAFVRDATWVQIPTGTRAAVSRTVGNALSLAVGSSRAPAVEIALRTVQSLGSTGRSSVLGRGEQLSLLHAPLVNGLAMHVEDFDDTHLPTVVHPGAPIVPAAIAMAEELGSSGTELLTAVGVGVEVTLRVASSVCPEHFDRGWHVTGTAGHLGAAMAAGRLLGLDADRLTVALGLAATQASGLTAALGSMTKPFHPGKAASDGTHASLLAEQDFSGPPRPIEGRRGFGALVSDRFDPEQARDGLGSRWLLDDNAFKPYACGIVSHAIIDAGIELAARAGTAEAETFHVRVHPVVLDVMGNEDPRDGLTSKFSAYHAFAVGFVDGAGGVAQFTDQRALAEDIVDVRRRVRVETDPGIAKGAAEVRALRGDEEVARVSIDHATGSAERPMSDEQLRSKAIALVEPVLGPDTQAFVERAFAVDEFGIEAVLEMARAAGSRQ